eukprot:GEMP01081047.1.p1 GENE.GEMP01081047.1~~GEMP01081047.1.p1  ORF type:complete len:231 (+),score=4.99 GEMP01081047.1:57-695(+)
MPRFFVTDMAKAHLGKELSAGINISSYTTGGKSQLAVSERIKGCRFRESELPRLCEDRHGVPIPDVLAQHQAEFDQLDYGEVFTASFFKAGSKEDSGFDFEARITFIRHKKVKLRSRVDVYRKGHYFEGIFKKPHTDPCKYERICKRIVGETGFEYIRQWPVLRNLFAANFATDGMMRRDPLTADEIECLLEYLKSCVQEDFSRFASDISEE